LDFFYLFFANENDEAKNENDDNIGQERTSSKEHGRYDVIILCGVEARLCGSEEVGAGASTLNFVAFHFQVVSATRIAIHYDNIFNDVSREAFSGRRDRSIRDLEILGIVVPRACEEETQEDSFAPSSLLLLGLFFYGGAK